VRALRFAVIGDPIAHSKSPAMHLAAFRALGLPHRYEARRVTAAELPGVVQELRDGRYDGLNVTVPHKEAVLALADERGADLRAANTLVRTPDGRVVAHNTDVPALVEELRDLGGPPHRGRPGARWCWAREVPPWRRSRRCACSAPTTLRCAREGRDRRRRSRGRPRRRAKR
jgi:shikimate 5-dehydrogenase